MTAPIRIRAYNVEFGDAILVTVPDEDDQGHPKTRQLLIDVGNKNGKRGGNKVFGAVVDAIHEAIKPDGIDLYVMTHEHLDHVEGLAEYVKTHQKLPFAIDRVWMTASAAPDYAARFPNAIREKKKLCSMYYALARLAAAQGLDNTDDRIFALLENNDPDMTDRCVNFLRTLAPTKTHYVHRGMDVSKLHPFRTARLAVWAPEEDSTAYYARKKEAPFSALGELDEKAARTYDAQRPIPLAGVDVSAFYNLVERRELSLMEGLFAIDKAANDTSVVFCFEWKRRKLLFVGDAEQMSWRMMDANNLLEPVSFLKIGHHGSHNATPPDELLQKILPKGQQGKAILSTCVNGYNGVPDEDTLKRIKSRATVVSTQDVMPGSWVDVEIEPG
jgi:beta-lactamase superfamily II metal-dependent hydrolase